MKIKVYIRSSPNAWIFENVINLCTEGGLLRITQGKGNNQWFPLSEIFRIVQINEDKIEASK